MYIVGQCPNTYSHTEITVCVLLCLIMCRNVLHKNVNLRGWALHSKKGSPIVGAGQLQMGLWLITWQSAPYPHTPGHGSIHLVFAHALSRGQSELMTHSGRQPLPVGLPWNPGKHSQSALPPEARHSVLAPQGEGLHGFTSGCSEIRSIIILHSNAEAIISKQT